MNNNNNNQSRSTFCFCWWHLISHHQHPHHSFTWTSFIASNLHSIDWNCNCSKWSQEQNVIFSITKEKAKTEFKGNKTCKKQHLNSFFLPPILITFSTIRILSRVNGWQTKWVKRHGLTLDTCYFLPWNMARQTTKKTFFSANFLVLLLVFILPFLASNVTASLSPFFSHLK